MPTLRRRRLISEEPRVNDRIRVPEVRLVGPNGEQVGIVRVEDALRLAAESDLDLVEVAPMAKPPVCKLMDYGKYKYETAQKAREARRNQTHTVIKEMKLRPKIDKHDYETKKGHIERFLGQGDKVKVTIMFRGREMQHPELGKRILDNVADAVAHTGRVEVVPKVDGRNMTMVLVPDRKAQQAHAAAKDAGDEPVLGATSVPGIEADGQQPPADPAPSAPTPPLTTEVTAAAEPPAEPT